MLAGAARRCIAPVWPAWHAGWGGSLPSPQSRYTCVRTSLFIMRLLADRGIAGTLRSGVPDGGERGAPVGPFGFHADGSWHGHAWVEAGGCIVDITADQFGDAPVIVVPVPDPRYAAGEGCTALPPPGRNATEAVAAIWQGLRHTEDFASFYGTTDS